MKSYIEDKKNLYTSIIEFLKEFDEHNNDQIKKESFTKLNKVIRNQQIVEDKEEMHQFLEIINSIGEHHHRDQHFNERMNQLLLHYKDQIKQTLPNQEIFHIFENNKKIVHFLLQKDIITISDEISKEMVNKIERNGNQYCHFFIPELEIFLGEEKTNSIKNELLKENPNFFTNYEEKRQEGENDSYICSLIRQDSVVKFISHINHHNISPFSEISPSVFETNPFLNDNKNPTLIEYSAFFGSIQIFQYLLANKAELTPSLWLYAIHSKNAELIYILESNNVPFPKSKKKEKNEEENIENSSDNYEQCLIESIKCHHNDIADYFINNYLYETKNKLKQNEEIISKYIKYHNYSYFQLNGIINHGFFYLNYYHYDKLFKLLLKENEKSIEKKKINSPSIQRASDNYNYKVEVIYHNLLQMQEIPKNHFEYSSITQIAIPSSITSIGEGAFSACFSLTQITIPSSVISIGNHAFLECISLTKITIPSSVTSIGDDVFCGCSSLTQITIPSSTISIGECIFCECLSLSNLTIIQNIKKHIELYNNEFLLYKSNPNSEIYDTFLWFKPKMNKVIIPSFITRIAGGLFYKCSSLTQITIPSSVISIGNYAFAYCSSLTQIKFEIPSSITSIGDDAFRECSSLTQITIPSSVNSIGISAFSCCSSLIQITIPSSVTSIKEDTFFGCLSLEKITIPSSITSIRNGAFYGCSSLAQITISTSVTSIDKHSFQNLDKNFYIAKMQFMEELKNIKYINNSTLYVADLPIEKYVYNPYCQVGESFLKQLFEGYGVSLSPDAVKIEIKNGIDGIPYAFAYIKFETHEEAQRAASELNYTKINGVPIRLIILDEKVEYNLHNNINNIGLSIKNLDPEIEELTLHSTLEKFGRIIACKIPNENEEKYLSYGYGFVCFHNPEDAKQTMIYLKDSSINNCPAEIEPISYEVQCDKCSLLEQNNNFFCLKEIGEKAFFECSSLTQITIPSSLTSIGESAFDGCSSLEKITVVSPNDIK